MARKLPFRLEDMAKAIVEGVGRTGRVEGSVSCTTRNDSSNDYKSVRNYSIPGMKVVDEAVLDKGEESEMVKNAFGYIQYMVGRIKPLDFESEQTSNYQGKFIFKGRTDAKLQKDKIYREFLENGKNLYGASDFSKNADSKKRLLETYFPGQFGANGTQSLDNRGYSNAQIGALFNSFYEKAKERLDTGVSF